MNTPDSRLHWAPGVHEKVEWEYIGSFEMIGIVKGDVYRHVDTKQYNGISVQTGPDYPDYSSSEWLCQGAPAHSASQAMLLAYAMNFDRTKK